MRIALALERYHTAAHGDVDRTPMMRWSDSSPLVNDLMAAGIRLCSYTIGVDPERSQTLIVPLQSMHHACSDWRSQTFCADSLTDLNPSFARGATRQKTLLCIGHNMWHSRGAASTAQNRRIRPRVLITVTVPSPPAALWALWSNASGHTTDEIGRTAG